MADDRDPLLASKRRYNNKMPFHTISSRAVWFLFSLLLALVPSGPARAVIVEDLYVAEVLVTDQGLAQRRSGARSGLQQVLVRVSGRADADRSSLVRAALRNPDAYYYQFSYDRTEQTLLRDDERVPAMLLRIHFEPSAVARLLREADLPVWGSNRPAVMLWVAVSTDQQRRILAESGDGEVITSLENQARRRGLPLVFPILDLEDAARISVAEVWGAFLERVEAASARYDPDAILTARIQQEIDGSWNSRWAYSVGGDWKSIESTSVSSGELARSMIDRMADDLAGRFALGSSRSSVDVVVENVPDLERYAAVSGYLEQLAPVVSSTITSLDRGEAVFNLQIEGQYSQLLEIIELDQRLLLLAGKGSDRLTYRWVE